MSQSDEHNSPLAEKKQIENETVFRSANEKVQREIENLKKTADEDSDLYETLDETKLHFLCECSDENCDQRIVMTLNDYRKMHKDRKHFIVCPDHEAVNIETVVDKKPKYNLVKKFMTPPEFKTKLQSTDTNNV